VNKSGRLARGGAGRDDRATTLGDTETLASRVDWRLSTIGTPLSAIDGLISRSGRLIFDPHSLAAHSLARRVIACRTRRGNPRFAPAGGREHPLLPLLSEPVDRLTVADQATPRFEGALQRHHVAHAPIAAGPGQCGTFRKRTPCGRLAFGDWVDSGRLDDESPQ
jgi:hypothetical protein